MNTHSFEKCRIELAMREAGFNVDVPDPADEEDGAHLIVRWKDGPSARVRIVTRNISQAKRHAAFRIKSLPEKRRNYFFVFRSVRTDKTWLMSADEFNRKAEGKKFLNFLGPQRDELAEYEAGNFDRLREIT